MNSLTSFLELDLEKNFIKIGHLPPIDLDSLYKVIFKIIAVIVIMFLMYISIKIGNVLIEKFIKKQGQSNLKFTMNQKKATTVAALLKSLLKYVVYFLGLVTIASFFFSGVSLAFAGIGGTAIGFGAKDLITDLINGIFILFEDQFAVGDYVTLGNYSGIVQSIGIRTTTLKDFSGDVHLIPNGGITTVTNHSRGNMRVMLDIDIAYEEDIDNAIDVINKVCEDFSKDNKDIVEAPKVIGVQALKDYSVTIRVSGSAKSMTQWSVERNLRKLIKETLDKKNIEIPYPKAEYISKTNTDGNTENYTGPKGIETNNQEIGNNINNN